MQYGVFILGQWVYCDWLKHSQSFMGLLSASFSTSATGISQIGFPLLNYFLKCIPINMMNAIFTIRFIILLLLNTLQNDFTFYHRLSENQTLKNDCVIEFLLNWCTWHYMYVVFFVFYNRKYKILNWIELNEWLPNFPFSKIPYSIF